MKVREHARRGAMALAAFGIIGGWMASPVQAEGPQHCVVELVPESSIEGTDRSGPIEVRQVDRGCYPTYAEAVAAGTRGGTKLDASTTPVSVTQRMVTLSSEPLAASVMIGTEYVNTQFGGNSKSYFAPQTCAPGVIWEDSYVGDAWNDNFESGKGFGGCDKNKKFAASNFGGNSRTCKPNCAGYGALRNEVSSLRWRP